MWFLCTGQSMNPVAAMSSEIKGNSWHLSCRACFEFHDPLAMTKSSICAHAKDNDLQEICQRLQLPQSGPGWVLCPADLPCGEPANPSRLSLLRNWECETQRERRTRGAWLQEKDRQRAQLGQVQPELVAGMGRCLVSRAAEGDKGHAAVLHGHHGATSRIFQNFFISLISLREIPSTRQSEHVLSSCSKN